MQEHASRMTAGVSHQSGTDAVVPAPGGGRQRQNDPGGPSLTLSKKQREGSREAVRSGPSWEWSVSRGQREPATSGPGSPGPAAGERVQVPGSAEWSWSPPGIMARYRMETSDYVPR